MGRGIFVIALAASIVGCGGNQTLFVASDRPEELTVTINGSESKSKLQTFHAYNDVKLTKGAEVIVTSGGTQIDKITLPPIEEGNYAMVFVSGAPGLKLVDYKSLAKIGKGSSPNDMKGLTGISPADIDIAPIDESKRWVSFDKRAVVAHPDAPMPVGGKVNQFTYEKFPIYRVERVPPGSDPFETIKVRVNTELGLGKMPGTTR